MADAFIYPLEQCGLDARSLALAEQVVRCLNSGNIDIAESSTRIFEARASRLRGVERAYAFLVLRELYLANDRLKPARDLSGTVRDHFTSNGDGFGLALNMSLDASIAYYEGDTSGSRRRLSDIADLASRLRAPADRSIIEVTHQLIEIRADMSASRYRPALNMAEKAKKTVKRIQTAGTERLFNLTLCFQAKLHYFLQDYRNAERVFLRLIEQDWYIDEARTYLGRIKYHNRELDQAAQIFERSLARFKRKDNTRRKCNTKQELARTKLELDDVAEAERLFRETNDELKPVKEFPFERGRALLGLAQCRYRDRDFQAALDTVYDALKIFDWIGNRQNQIRCKTLEAWALIERGDHERAAAALSDAKARFEPESATITPHLLDRARVLQAEAVLAARRGDYGEAVARSGEAIEILRRVHVPESDYLYTDVLLESVLYLFMRSEPYEEILRRLRTAHRIADYRREARSMVKVHLLRSACLASRDLFGRAGSELRRALESARSDRTRRERAVADIVTDVLDGYLILAAPNALETERFVSGLAKLVEMPVLAEGADDEARRELRALSERFTATLAAQQAAHRGTVSNVDLLRLTVQKDRRRFGGADYFFECLKTADYSAITAAVRRCTILEDVQEFERAKLPDLIRFSEKYDSSRARS